MQLKQGTLLQGGKYRIEKVLGQGGFGITYLAIQTGLDRKVAVKEFFMKELCERNESTSYVTLGSQGSKDTVNRFREKFLKEARNIAKLNHPNIVRIIDVFEENGTAYYVMEYAAKGSLAELVKRQGYLSESVATSYIRQVADALAYIHARNMNHLDVKPGNVMINEEDNAILIDFGLSKQYDATTGSQTSTTPVGISHGYAPLEQYKEGGVGEFSPETDIYALGATFFKLLTGVTPPSASDVYEDGVPVNELQKRGVSKAAIDLICNAMKGRKKDRISNTLMFAELTNQQTDTKQSSQSIFPNEETIACNNDEHVTFDHSTFIIDPSDLKNPKSVEASAEMGNNESMFRLAVMYLRGEGKFQNERKAYDLLIRCKNNGDKRASTILSDWENVSAIYRKKTESVEPPTPALESKQKNVESSNADTRNKLIIICSLVAVAILSLFFISSPSNDSISDTEDDEWKDSICVDENGIDEKESTIAIDNQAQHRPEKSVTSPQKSQVASTGNQQKAPDHSEPHTHEVETAISSTPIDSKPAEQVHEEGNDEIFEIVDNSPVFPGGDAALMKYLSANLKYPATAQAQGIQGRVVVQFVIEKNGSISNIKIVRTVDPDLDREAIRVVSSMPRWTPGTQRGKIVRVKYTLPIMFRLQ